MSRIKSGQGCLFIEQDVAVQTIIDDCTASISKEKSSANKLYSFDTLHCGNKEIFFDWHTESVQYALEMGWKVYAVDEVKTINTNREILCPYPKNSSDFKSCQY